MSRDGWAVLIGLVIGSLGSAAWTHWRHRVVKELRIIRRILQEEQEPTLRAIRDLLKRGTDDDET